MRIHAGILTVCLGGSGLLASCVLDGQAVPEVQARVAALETTNGLGGVSGLGGVYWSIGEFQAACTL